MKLLLNCDQVFDVLTRGPFPTGDASDEAVEHHLVACHDCRQLAEALRPAVSLLHEAVSSQQAQRLPEYQGSLPALDRRVDPYSSPRPLALGLRQLDRAPAPPRRSFDYAQLVNGLRLIAASVLVVTLGTLAWGLVVSARNQGVKVAGAQRAAPSFAGAMVRPDEKGLVTLARLDLPVGCFPLGADWTPASSQADAPQHAAADSAADALRCCTHCHAEGEAAAHVQVAANTRFQQSCTACHRG
jgi:hypothetical protein